MLNPTSGVSMSRFHHSWHFPMAVCCVCAGMALCADNRLLAWINCRAGAFLYRLNDQGATWLAPQLLEIKPLGDGGHSWKPLKAVHISTNPYYFDLRITSLAGGRWPRRRHIGESTGRLPQNRNVPSRRFPMEQECGYHVSSGRLAPHPDKVSDHVKCITGWSRRPWSIRIGKRRLWPGAMAPRWRS